MRISGICAALVAAVMVVTPFARGDEPAKKEATTATPPKAIVAEIEACIKKLGAESFRDRRKASKRLLEIAAIAKGNGEKPDTPYKAYVLKRMEALFTHDDPEVSQRAKKICDSLEPFRNVDLSKLVKLPHFVDQDTDTIKGIAEMYGSKPIWIMAANPGLKTDADLRARKEIQVPVSPDGDAGEDGGMIIEIE